MDPFQDFDDLLIINEIFFILSRDLTSLRPLRLVSKRFLRLADSPIFHRIFTPFHFFEFDLKNPHSGTSFMKLNFDKYLPLYGRHIRVFDFSYLQGERGFEKVIKFLRPSFPKIEEIIGIATNFIFSYSFLPTFFLFGTFSNLKRLEICVEISRIPFVLPPSLEILIYRERSSMQQDFSFVKKCGNLPNLKILNIKRFSFFTSWSGPPGIQYENINELILKSPNLLELNISGFSNE